MKFFDDLRSLDRNNIGGWPQSIKIFFTALLFVVIGFLGWYLYISDQQDSLQTLAGKEEQLKQEFAQKQAKAVNLDALQQQLEEMQDMLRQLLRQLPGKTEMPELLGLTRAITPLRMRGMTAMLGRIKRKVAALPEQG